MDGFSTCTIGFSVTEGEETLRGLSKAYQYLVGMKVKKVKLTGSLKKETVKKEVKGNAHKIQDLYVFHWSL